MKDRLTDARYEDFPKTHDGRVYHLGTRAGEVANRIVTVGPPSRARALATRLDPQPVPFELESERGFLTITGRHRGVPVSIVAIGMGAPNMDFFVRECRECVNGDMIIVRLGSCGCLTEGVPVGSVVAPRGSVNVSRNWDFDFSKKEADSQSSPPYLISRPVLADSSLQSAVLKSVEAIKPADITSSVLGNCVNASADSFYSSQGRRTAFPDHNQYLLDLLEKEVKDIATLEMETFHLLHLAHSWNSRPSTTPDPNYAYTLPPTNLPVSPTSSHSKPHQLSPRTSPTTHGRIRAAAVHMVFASRVSQDFITPERVEETQNWTGDAVLSALSKFPIDDSMMHPAEGSVW